jgi:hypothetical protein
MYPRIPNMPTVNFTISDSEGKQPKLTKLGSRVIDQPGKTKIIISFREDPLGIWNSKIFDFDLPAYFVLGPGKFVLNSKIALSTPTVRREVNFEPCSFELPPGWKQGS